MELKDLFDACRMEAIVSKLEPTYESTWRKMCRSYSKKFSTPLQDVLKMDPEHVVLNYYEDDMEDVDVEDKIDKILDLIYSTEDPDYDAQKETDLKDFIAQVEADEEERIKNNVPLMKSLSNKKKDSTKKTVVEKINGSTLKSPLGGSVDFSRLQNEESGDL